MKVNELIQKLLELTFKIYECYNYLKIYDYNNQHNLKIYEDKLNELKLLLEEEKEIYSSLKDRDLIQRLLLSLTSKDKINNFSEDIFTLIQNNQDLPKRRIVLKLLTIKQSIDKSKLLAMAKEVDKELKESKSRVKNSYYGIINLLSLSEEIRKDFINTILLIINNDSYINKKVVIDLLYNCAFLFDFCEEELLNNNFLINKDIYWTSSLVVDLHKMDKNEVVNTKELFGIEIIKRFKKDINIEYIKIILRVALLFCKKEEILALEKDSNITSLIKQNKDDLTLVKKIGLR